ncbi:hypothetical protein N665_0800s0029 [Sinapis alba]|nr:hypothetical protein N665_0800s0029 [Sinapis alba]KAF8082934.1 hypothetical protein N665_0800s0029 [Sinapis alba]KAF8082935.1 hypothetical protein N665_0800s0029 [Sinapis alba]KAF8082936.1 hypothetical protein N665_0800s0029 [Sinapis alba]
MQQRTNLGELKGHIVKKIGVERSKRYFYYLSRFLSQKLTKSEFDKTCFRLLGRENLSLHNQLIRSILGNATVSKSPPPVQLTTKPVANGSESLAPNQNDPVCSNGVMRKRKMRDSPVGSNGHVLQQPVCREDNGCSSVGMEKGDLRRFNHQRSGRYDERDGEFLRPVAKPRIPCKDQVAVRDDENQEEQVRVNVSASPLVAPLGIPFCSASVGGGSRRMVPVSTSTDVMSCYNSGGLPETAEMVRKRMENIAVAQGLEGVSMECANTLNAMLDVYLKKLIKSCIHLVREQSLVKQQSQNKVNGTKDEHSVSLLDFRTAMELNPRQLGEDWPTLLERISIRSFEEHDLEV